MSETEGYATTKKIKTEYQDEELRPENKEPRNTDQERGSKTVKQDQELRTKNKEVNHGLREKNQDRESGTKIKTKNKELNDRLRKKNQDSQQDQELRTENKEPRPSDQASRIKTMNTDQKHRSTS